MNNLNQITLLGNLARDPEIKYTSEGTAITDLRIAVNKKYKDKDGNNIENVEFFNITAWNRLAENCAGELRKGDRVIVNGRINNRSFETKEGKKISILNIIADVVGASLEYNPVKIIQFEKEGISDFDEKEQESEK